MDLPEPIVIKRKFKCRNCTADHNFEEPCTACPNGNWGPELCGEAKDFEFGLVKMGVDTPGDGVKPLKLTESEVVEAGEETLPPTFSMVKSAITSVTDWARNGFLKTDDAVLENRVNICRSCEFWNSKAFHGTGRCMKCGCSTWAKLRIATEKCPVGKW